MQEAKDGTQTAAPVEHAQNVDFGIRGDARTLRLRACNQLQVTAHVKNQGKKRSSSPKTKQP